MVSFASIVTVLAFFIAASQVIEVQLPFLPMSIEEVGIVLIALLLLVVGYSFRISALLLTLFCVEFACDALYAIVHGDVVRVFMALAANGALFVAFSALHEKLAQEPERFLNILAKSWIWLAALSSAIVIMEFVDLLPKAAMVQGAVKIFPRPPGLQNDPNYAAYSFAVALLFLFVVHMNPRWKLALGTLLFVATIGTDSRMGLLLILIIWAYFWMSGWKRIRISQVVTRLTLLVFLVLGGTGVSLMSMTNNMELLGRFQRAADMLETISLEQLSHTKGYQKESSRERLLLAYGGLEVWQDNFWTGVGQERVVDEVRRRVGVGKATHNGYVDRLAISGIAGLAYLALIAYLLLRAGSLRDGCNPKLRDAARVTIVAIAIGSFFLNLSPWLPACLISAAIWSATSQRRRSEAAALSTET